MTTGLAQGQQGSEISLQYANHLSIRTTTLSSNTKHQAFSHVALALCDPGDEAILLAPYYFSHKLALQIAQATVRTCNWDPHTLLPDLQVGRRRGRRRFVCVSVG